MGMDSWEEYMDVDHAPTSRDPLVRVRSTDVVQPHFLLSLGLAHQWRWLGILGGVSLRSNYSNRGLTYGPTADITVRGDPYHPWVIPYLSVDFTPIEEVVLQIQVFLPIDTDPCPELLLPALGGSVRGRIPLAGKAKSRRNDETWADEDRDEVPAPDPAEGGVGEGQLVLPVL